MCPVVEKFLKIPLPLPYQSAVMREDDKLHKMARDCNIFVVITCSE